MKNDDHDFGGNLNGGNAEGDSPIPRELQARIVAAIAGEASAFEAAELERLAAETPAVAEFKRRIESVHGLVTEAARPDTQPLRLSAERRAKVLAVIGASDSAPNEAPANVVAMTPVAKPSRKKRILPWVLATATAACLPFLVVFFATGELSYKKPARPDPAQTVLGPSTGEQVAQLSAFEVKKESNLDRIVAGTKRLFQKKGASEENLQVTLELPVATAGHAQPMEMPSLAAPQAPVNFSVPDRGSASGQINQLRAPVTFGAGGNALTEKPSEALARYSAYDSKEVAAVPAATPAPAVPPASDIVKMDAFVVSAEREGFAAAISTSRASTSVVAPPSLTDVAQTNIEIMARDRSILNGGAAASTDPTALTTSNIAAGETFNFKAPMGSAAVDSVAQQNSPVTVGGAVVVNSASGNVIVTGGSGGRTTPPADTEARMDLAKELADLRKLNEAPAAGQRGQETGALNQGVITLSPFQVSSDKDTGYAAKATAGITLGASTIGANLSGFGSILNDADEKKADAPLARAKAAVDESLRLETSTATQAVSTFSLHVSDVSFRLAQAALARGEAPDAATIRPEEFYNAFNYGDPVPAVAEKVGCWQEQSAHPFLAQRNLLRIALKVAATGRVGSTPLHLTVLLDTSGSMEREDRAATVRQAMEVLVSLLGPNDRLTLIGFARQPRLLAENLSGDRAREVLDLIARTPAEGGTNMEEALKLATQLALRHRDAKAQNRIVMLTDGAANLGNAVPEQLATRIDELRQRGIAFDACGVGLDGLDDGILEALTRKGDGRYYVLNTPGDAGGGFAQKLAGAFRPAAENVKVQVRFNPARVATYRLIGFEQHRLKEQDFRNDKVDAAELAAEEAGVALYQFEPLSQGEGDVGEVFVRFRDPATGAMVERSWTIPYEARVTAFDRAAPSLQLAGVAALLAEKLRNDAGAAQITLRDFATVMSTLHVRYRNEPRVQELATMFAQARRLTGQ